MKQKDIALIIIIAFFSAIVSFFVSSKVFTTPKSRTAQVEQVSNISSAFPLPDKKFFNSSSIDPVQLIQIGNNNNTNIFTGTNNQGQ